MTESDHRAGPIHLVGNDQVAIVHCQINRSAATVAMLSEYITIGIERAVAVCHDLGRIGEIQMQQCLFRIGRACCHS